MKEGVCDLLFEEEEEGYSGPGNTIKPRLSSLHSGGAFALGAFRKQFQHFHIYNHTKNGMCSGELDGFLLKTGLNCPRSWKFQTEREGRRLDPGMRNLRNSYTTGYLAQSRPSAPQLKKSNCKGNSTGTTESSQHN